MPHAANPEVAGSTPPSAVPDEGVLSLYNFHELSKMGQHDPTHFHKLGLPMVTPFRAPLNLLHLFGR